MALWTGWTPKVSRLTPRDCQKGPHSSKRKADSLRSHRKTDVHRRMWMMPSQRFPSRHFEHKPQVLLFGWIGTFTYTRLSRLLRNFRVRTLLCLKANTWRAIADSPLGYMSSRATSLLPSFETFYGIRRRWKWLIIFITTMQFVPHTFSGRNYYWKISKRLHVKFCIVIIERGRWKLRDDENRRIRTIRLAFWSHLRKYSFTILVVLSSHGV
jgi:hypothetical protein